jgi:hypothetical protein
MTLHGFINGHEGIEKCVLFFTAPGQAGTAIATPG